MSDDPNKLEEITIKLRDKLFEQLDKFDNANEVDERSLDEQLKSYTGLFKLLQSLEEMIRRIEQERDKKSDRQLDILEFRQQLEKQIAKIVDSENEGIFPQRN